MKALLTATIPRPLMSTSGAQTMFRFNQTQSVDSFGLDPEDNTSENQEHQLYQTLFQSLSQKP